MRVTFSTNVYENTYSAVLLEGRLKIQLEATKNYPFYDKTIIVNEVKNREKVTNIIKTNFPDFKIYYSEDDFEEVLKYFGITKPELTYGYQYSIHHFNKFYHSDADYIFHISEDCAIKELDDNFINNAIEIMEKDDRIITAQPSWQKDCSGAIEEMAFEIGDFFAEFGFADQMYLAKVSEFKNNIYLHKHDASKRYPNYGGECFEKRVDSYMHTFDKYRIVHKKSWYAHNGW